MLQQQESLHHVEMRKWQRVLHTAAQLLRQVKYSHYILWNNDNHCDVLTEICCLIFKTEESLTELQMSIHPTATEKMFSVLKSSVNSFNSRTEQRSHSEM